MERFDEMLKAMAKKEECIVPNGFDERVQEALDALPQERKRKRGLGVVKGALIAAAACVLLVGTAFGASSGLREMLGAALGGFAPYAQEQEGEAYVINGVKFRVVSALADDFTVRVYVEARDLEGDRLSGDMYASGAVDVPRKAAEQGTTFGADCLGYDEDTKTALLAVSSWGQVMADDLTGAKAIIFSLTDRATREDFWENGKAASIPVDIRPMPSFVAAAELATALHAEEVRLSALGLSVIFDEEKDCWSSLAMDSVQVRLIDGTIIRSEAEGLSGSGAFSDDTGRTHMVVIWNFREPVEAEQIEGIFVGEDYFPVK